MHRTLPVWIGFFIWFVTSDEHVLLNPECFIAACVFGANESSAAHYWRHPPLRQSGWPESTWLFTFHLPSALWAPHWLICVHNWLSFIFHWCFFFLENIFSAYVPFKWLQSVDHDNGCKPKRIGSNTKVASDTTRVAKKTFRHEADSDTKLPPWQ